MTFTAPYSFIPLVAPLPSAFGEGAPSHTRPEPDGACGALTVDWVFERPVLIGGPTADAQGFAVFATDAQGRPTLPGATTRGLVRALIEIAAGARMDIYDRDAHFAVRDSDDKRIWRPASPIANGRALSFGWLRRRDPRKAVRERDFDGWVIEIVQRAYQLETSSLVGDVCAFEALNVGEKIVRLQAEKRLHINASIQPKLNASRFVEKNFAQFDPQGGVSGWVVVTGVDPARTPKPGQATAPKKYATLFVDQPTGNTFDVPREIMRRFVKTHNTTPGEGSCAWDWWREQLNEFMPTDGRLEIPGIPVFIGHAVPSHIDARNAHAERNGALSTLLTQLQSETGHNDDPALLYLSLSRFVKVPHQRSLRQIVEPRGPGAALDFARAMFGQVPPEKLEPEVAEEPGRGALKGRVSFGEAALWGATSPTAESKIGATMSPRASFWPYYLRPGVPSSEPYDYSNPTSEIAGWKRYPVRAQAVPFLRDDRPNAPPMGPNGVRPTESGMRFLRATPEAPLVFRGEIRLHNLKPAEIGALLWALTWGDGADGARRPQRHLAGRGKAQGYGLCFARVIGKRIATNRGDPELSDAEYICAFKNHVLEAWNKVQPIAAADFESLPMVAALLTMGDPTVANGLEDLLVYPSFPPRRWEGGAYSLPRPAAGMNPDSSPSLEGYKAVRKAASEPGHATSVLPPYPPHN